MAFTVITKNSEKTFTDKELINISSKDGYDFVINFDFDFILTIKYDRLTNKCTLLNQFNCQNILFKGMPVPQSLEIEKTARLLIKDSDDFILIKVDEQPVMNNITSENLTEQDLKDFYGENVNAAARLKIEKRKEEIEKARVAIIKQTYYSINTLTHKISMNSKTGILLHIALFAASIILSFGLCNYLTGLPIKDAGSLIHLPVNMKILIMYSIIVYSCGLVLKQGIYLFLQNKLQPASENSSISEKIMIIISSVFFSAIYIINLLYYMSDGSMPFFAIFMSLFFTFVAVVLAMACGYFKSSNVEISKDLNKYEYREDLEFIIKQYQQWIERYINNLSDSKINAIKDSLFTLQIKSGVEIIIGILTAPFLAYGVSNTLAMCFPEAAGWVRISGLRFSPVFLVLASFMIIFAFFAFVNGFLCSRKIQASAVLKNDGFSNYLQHGLEIFGLQGIKKLDSEMRRSFIIGLSIIFIEFSMNISYFMQEIGQDLQGMSLSFLAALVPTALLIAETYMLSRTKFETQTLNDLISKIDK